MVPRAIDVFPAIDANHTVGKAPIVEAAVFKPAFLIFEVKAVEAFCAWGTSRLFMPPLQIHRPGSPGFQFQFTISHAAPGSDHDPLFFGCTESCACLHTRLWTVADAAFFEVVGAKGF